ncbi:unnamed protein product [Rangifer tarandus platyrhynchus]|uniref:Uncharacterized protein n=2 Tax=Rangifer tarandus platyrhynchus TaxID=3082113 RepID=A0ABN8YI33_RANTA|nr:unnamed protein product [Rangifer tarandus platyrhynchus]CAI9697755.1 unnamed protein product [Rangifer tarandus platyrhynchus]
MAATPPHPSSLDSRASPEVAGPACTNGNTRAKPKELDLQAPARSNVGRWRRLRKRTAQAGREEPKRAGDGNSRSGGAPEAVADLRAEAAAATEAGPPV